MHGRQQYASETWPFKLHYNRYCSQKKFPHSLSLDEFFSKVCPTFVFNEEC